MPDITMCKGGGCPRKDECYRHVATPSQFMQSWFSNIPINHDGSCDYFSHLYPLHSQFTSEKP